jgi:phospholipid/cholesterol/gamma-HCH transport system substrate-binding protein
MIESRRRTTTVPLGAVFFVLLAVFIGWSVTKYDGTFDDAVNVDVVLGSAGNALPLRADVKVRGVLVGHVDSTSVRDGAVVAHLAITPSFAPMISTDATARLLPKTLFGERYVALNVPVGPVDPVVDGSVLEQDVSGNAVEVGVLLDGLQPLLEAIPPQDLASTLGALAQGLSGKGEQIGSTIDRLENIFEQVNADMPALQDDIRGVADLADTYSEALPSLVTALDNFRTTGNTVVERRPAVDTLIASLTSSSATTSAWRPTPGKRSKSSSSTYLPSSASSTRSSRWYRRSPKSSKRTATFPVSREQPSSSTRRGDTYPTRTSRDSWTIDRPGAYRALR